MKTKFKTLALNISKLTKSEPKLKLSIAHDCILILNQLVKNQHQKEFDELFGLLSSIISNYENIDLSLFDKICKKCISKSKIDPKSFIKNLRKAGFSAIPKINDISIFENQD